MTKTSSSEVTIKKQVEKSKINKLLEKNLDGVYYSRDNSRVYPYNEFLTSVLGFTSSDGKGQAGLELYYDKYLSGINGEILYQTDIVGVEIDNKNVEYVPATDGLNLQLTIDYQIQQLCENAMEKAMQVHKAKSAQMLVIDPNSGAVKALVCKPSYNLNEIPRDDLPTLNALGRNGIVCDVYEPGSTFKILTTAAKIEEYMQNGQPVLFTRDTHYEDYMDTQEGFNLPVMHCVEGTEGWEIESSLKIEDAMVFDKITFGSPELAAYIQEAEYDSVTLVGVCTDICVISNAMLIKAFDPEVLVQVDSACCAGVTPESHQNALNAMKQCQIEIL